jgi:prolyl-tRNA editing enzyme YbaK/EbsC (Cys-tRNA(Pro) deacylase)
MVESDGQQATAGSFTFIAGSEDGDFLKLSARSFRCAPTSTIWVEKEDAVMLFADCETGAIPALGPAYGVDTIVEDSLLAEAQVYFEAGDHEHLVRMATQDFVRVLGDCPHGQFAKAA